MVATVGLEDQRRQRAEWHEKRSHRVRPRGRGHELGRVGRARLEQEGGRLARRVVRRRERAPVKEEGARTGLAVSQQGERGQVADRTGQRLHELGTVDGVARSCTVDDEKHVGCTPRPAGAQNLQQAQGLLAGAGGRVVADHV